MTKSIFHDSASRGFADHGWLQSHHTFSFASYYNPERMNFGALRVLNDDTIAPSSGFGTHPHANMEIVSIPLSGAVRHKDSMGHEHVIRAGEVQVMSAGTGITHSEYNASDTESAQFLQIWILPEKQNTKPSYGQKEFAAADRQNRWQILVSPDGRDGSLVIGQNAFFVRTDLTAAQTLEYQPLAQATAVYCFVIAGALEIGGTRLTTRDGCGWLPATSLALTAVQPSQVLLMEVAL